MSHKKSLGPRSPQNPAPLFPQASPAGVVGLAPVTPGLDHTSHNSPSPASRGQAFHSTYQNPIGSQRSSPTNLLSWHQTSPTHPVRGRQIVPVKAQAVNTLGFEFHILCPLQIVYPAVASKRQPEITWVDECGRAAASLHFQKQTMEADTCSPLSPGLLHSLCSASENTVAPQLSPPVCLHFKAPLQPTSSWTPFMAPPGECLPPLCTCWTLERPPAHPCSEAVALS